MNTLFLILIIILSLLLVLFIFIKKHLDKSITKNLPDELEVELGKVATKINQLELGEEFKEELVKKLDYEYNKTNKN